MANQPRAAHDRGLTRAERQILHLIVRHGSVREAIRSSDRAESTVRTHVYRLHQKTDSHTCGELILWALANLEHWRPEEGAEQPS